MDEEVADAVGITDYELVALIDMDATPEGTRVLEALGLADLLSNDTAVRAGYASLLVRGMADADDEGIAAGAEAAAIGEMMATADDIIVLELRHDEVEFGRSVLVDAEVGSFLLDQTDSGVNVAQPLEPSTDLLDLVREILDEMAGGGPAGPGPGGPFDAVITRFPVQGEARSVRLRVDSPGSWHVDAADAAGTAADSGDAVASGAVASDAVASDAVGDGSSWPELMANLGLSDAAAASGARRAH